MLLIKRVADNPKNRRYLIAALILVVGLSSALLIYLTAGNESENTLNYIIVGGQAYPMKPEDSKIYRHDLELYGGKLNVVGDQVMRWFAGLWRGRSLAFTVGIITVLMSLGFLFFTGHHTSAPKCNKTDRIKGKVK